MFDLSSQQQMILSRDHGPLGRLQENKDQAMQLDNVSIVWAVIVIAKSSGSF